MPCTRRSQPLQFPLQPAKQRGSEPPQKEIPMHRTQCPDLHVPSPAVSALSVVFQLGGRAMSSPELANLATCWMESIEVRQVAEKKKKGDAFAMYRQASLWVSATFQLGVRWLFCLVHIDIMFRVLKATPSWVVGSWNTKRKTPYWYSPRRSQTASSSPKGGHGKPGTKEDAPLQNLPTVSSVAV